MKMICNNEMRVIAGDDRGTAVWGLYSYLGIRYRVRIVTSMCVIVP